MARILGDTATKLREHSIEGIELDQKRIGKYVEDSLMLVTALSPVIGYDKASKIAHHAMENNLSLKAAALKLGYVTAEEFDKIVQPTKMVGNPRRDLGMPA